MLAFGVAAEAQNQHISRPLVPSCSPRLLQHVSGRSGQSMKDDEAHFGKVNALFVFLVVGLRIFGSLKQETTYGSESAGAADDAACASHRLLDHIILLVGCAP